MREPISSQLRRFANNLQGQPVGLEELQRATRGRTRPILLLLLSLPFLSPVPIPGLSSALGAIIAIIGIQMAFRRPLWLPKRVRAKKISAEMLAKIINGASHLFRFLEKFLRPRLRSFQAFRGIHILAGIFIAISGIFMLLPLPIPFTNGLPAITVMLLAVSTIQKDGFFYLIGCVMFLINLVIFGAIAFGGAQAVDWLTKVI